MSLQTIVNLIKEWPKLSVSIASTFGAGMSFGGWLLYAEQCHAQTRANQKTIEELVEFQNGVVKEKELEALQEKQKLVYIRSACLSGKIKDVEDCAAVGVKIKDE